MKKLIYFIFILNILCLGGCGLLEEDIKENDEEIVVENTLVSEIVQDKAVKNEKEPDISISAKSWEIINRANSNLLADNAVDGEAVSQQETVLLQFLGQSGVYRGQKIDACEVIYPETTEYSYFHLNFSGGYYEVITDKTGQFLISISGPHYDEVDELPTPAYLTDIKDEVYQNLITEMVETGVFPVSGTQCDGMPYGQSYAVVDIDADGQDELIINYANASATAGMVYYIYDYDRATGEVYIERAGWPDMSFYDNGYVKEEASHNHGRSNLDDFWPYHLLVYNPEMDEYESITHVDAWQKELYPKDFPEKMDVDGDGVVYYTAASSYIPTDFMDKAEYDIWCEQYNTGIIKKIQWKPIMTEEDYVAIYMQDAVG